MTETSDIQMDLDTCIEELVQEGIYKYPGVNEGMNRSTTCHRKRKNEERILSQNNSDTQELA